MRYDDFKAAWTRALRDSGLPTIGWPTETMDLGSMDRWYSVGLLPHGGQDSEPFHVTASIEFWQAILLPRHWDDDERRDDEPDEQLAAMFARLKLAMRAWMESLDHLCPAKVA